MANAGISVIVCCHNGAKRLPNTLQHLLAQKVSAGIPWEVIVVDNASKDNARGVAKQCWPVDAPASLVVVAEPRLGLARARTKGVLIALYEYIVFIDDNNWLSPDWLQTAYNLMTSNPEIVACGGSNEAIYESTPPEWLPKGIFALGTQAEKSGYVSEARSFLWGAGLMILKSVYEKLVAAGFGWRLASRYRHEILQSGEDEELTRALALTGRKLWYDQGLTLKCFIPTEKMSWAYCRKLYFGYGEASDIFDSYRFVARKGLGGKLSFSRSWFLRSLEILWTMILTHHIRIFKYCFSSCEGDFGMLDFEYKLGQLIAVLQLKSDYGKNFDEVEKLRDKVFDGALAVKVEESRTQSKP